MDKITLKNQTLFH